MKLATLYFIAKKIIITITRQWLPKRWPQRVETGSCYGGGELAEGGASLMATCLSLAAEHQPS